MCGGRIAAITLRMLLCAASVGVSAAETSRETRFDSTQARVEFEIAALWLLRRHGDFGHIDGQLLVDPQTGSARIAVRIRVDSVRMKDPDHRRLLLSPAFFDAGRHPWIEFTSESFALAGARESVLPGLLSVRGVRHKVRFVVDRGDCGHSATPHCEVRVRGSLRRSRFGMTEYRRTLSDRVHLRITVRLGEFTAHRTNPASPSVIYSKPLAWISCVPARAT
ncbi:MAG: YceI family protein [Xanthomonadales bacterium]|nr:hypothetical protein [Xanthomonadales bacterium]MCC6594045.1 YceI family protein [Xanthomonadales bacterium]MCE7932645.1 hypothetical protein [Xanthomonadales bacterium PRO6]